MMADRRRFLGTILGGWVATAVAGIIYPVGQYLNAPPMGEREKEITLTPGDIAVGEGLQILRQGQPVIVIRIAEDEFTTVSAVCTHLGCIVKWDRVSQTFECPCHAARFAVDGKVLGGPPQSGLPVLATRVENGVIVIGPA